MNILAAVVLSLALQGSQLAKPIPTPKDKTAKQQAHKGQWYFADNGHAVYCYGPVMMVTQTDGSLQRVATFCRAGEDPEQTMVPLRD